MVYATSNINYDNPEMTSTNMKQASFNYYLRLSILITTIQKFCTTKYWILK